MCFAQEKCNYDINKKRNCHKYTIFSYGFEYKSKPNSLEHFNMIMAENVSLEFQTNQMMIKKALMHLIHKQELMFIWLLIKNQNTILKYIFKTDTKSFHSKCIEISLA